MLHIPGLPKFGSSGVSEVFFPHKLLQVEETAVREMEYWKATPRDNVLLPIFNGAPIQDGLPTDASTTEIKTGNVLTILCYFFAAFPSLKVS